MITHLGRDDQAARERDERRLLLDLWQKSLVAGGQQENWIRTESSGTQVLGGHHCPTGTGAEHMRVFRDLAQHLAQQLTAGTAVIRVALACPAETVGESSVGLAEAESLQRRRDAWKAALEKIRVGAVHTGIRDLAKQHDHYLYGAPRWDAKE